MDQKIVLLWHGKLAALLARARSLPQSGEDAVGLAQEFEDFTHKHPLVLPEDPVAAQFDEMDEIARKTHDDLVQAEVDQRVAAIAGRTKEFQTLTAQIGGQTAANAKAAQSISFEQLTATVVAATDAVTALKELKAEIEAQTGAPGQLDALGAKLDTALAALQAFQDAAKADD